MTASSSRAAGARNIAIALLAGLLTGCGGGGDAGASGAVVSLPASASPSNPASAAPALTAAQQALAERLYAGTPRTPAGFGVDAAPVGATGQVATVHLKNSDLAPVAAGAARFEVCSDDVAEATAWSEAKAVATTPYADLVESNVTSRAFEFVRVPRGDSGARVRHRVFRCSHLDRSGTDLAAETGAAGNLRARPADGLALQQLSEYLWQFTSHNNADHVVTASLAVGTATAGALAHAIDMARLVRAAATGGCERIELLRWTHTLDAASGALARRLESTGSFGARRDGGGVVQGCTP
jgi:hypothetical protein